MKAKIILPEILIVLVAAVLTGCFVPITVGQSGGPAKPGSPAYGEPVTSKALPPPVPQFGGEIKQTAADSKPWWPPRIVPPKGAPNVLLIMLDDAGYGSESTFGGTIPTPALDRIAKAGLRYTQFHSAALCSPTRAALITGRNHHSVALRHGRRSGDRLSRLRLDHQQGHRDHRRDPAPERLCDLVVRQEPQRARLDGDPGRAVRPVADRHGLRVFLRLRRRRREPVAAEPLPQHDADRALRGQTRAGTSSPRWPTTRSATSIS